MFIITILIETLSLFCTTNRYGVIYLGERHLITSALTNKWRILIVAFMSSVIMTTIFCINVEEAFLSFEAIRLLVIVVFLHLPLVASYYLKWKYFHVVSIIGWFIIWIGFIYYILANNEGMKDLVVTAWVTVAWAATQGIAIILQVFISFKERRKEPS